MSKLAHARTWADNYSIALFTPLSSSQRFNSLAKLSSQEASLRHFCHLLYKGWLYALFAFAYMERQVNPSERPNSDCHGNHFQ